MAVDNSPPVRQRTSNDRLQQFKERYREIAGSLTYARDDELNSLRSELADTQLHVTQLQQLLEEDSEAHPSNVTLYPLDCQQGARKGKSDP